MLTAEAGIETGRPSRYLIQLCRHTSHMGGHLHHRPRPRGGDAPPEVRHAEWSGTDGIVAFGWGQCILRAVPGALMLRAEAADEDSLRRIQDGIAGRIEKIGRRDHLTVTWQRPETPGNQPGEAG